MKKLIAIIIFALSVQYSQAAIGAGTVWEGNASATASMVNGGGFNTQNANFLTDLACTDGNTTTPDCTSASYTFVAGDSGDWLFVKSGVNWNTSGAGTSGGGCFFQIDSVAGGAATVDAAIGGYVCIQSGTVVSIPSLWVAGTVDGIATVASPTSGTFGVDYSQSTAAIATNTDLASTDGTTTPCTITSALAPFGVQDVGNIVHITAGTNWTVGWYEIVSVSVVTATLDRACGSAATLSGGTFYVGGALSLNSTLDSEFINQVIAGQAVYLKNGSFTIGEAVTNSADGTSSAAIAYLGYNTLRGDNPTSTNRPTIVAGANSVIWSAADYYILNNLILTSSNANGLSIGLNSLVLNVKSTNSSTGNGMQIGAGTVILNGEFSSASGTAVSINGAGGKLIGSYIHDSTTCIALVANRTDTMTLFNVLDTCTTGISIGSSANAPIIMNNTIFGAETPAGTGISAASTQATGITLVGNIIYGWTTGVSFNASSSSALSEYNNFYNNTTNSSNITAGSTDLAVDPAFTDSSTADFSIGTALKAAGFPGLLPGSGSTGYLDIGAVQRVEPAASGGGSYTFVGP